MSLIELRCLLALELAGGRMEVEAMDSVYRPVLGLLMDRELVKTNAAGTQIRLLLGGSALLAMARQQPADEVVLR